jgi:parvulin-like peptidyl-prolyl isomerase
MCHVLSVLAAVSGCAHQAAVPRASAPPAPVFAPAPSASAAAPELIEVRVLTVAYRDARGAGDQKRTREEALTRARMLVSMARSGDHLAELVGQYSDRAGATDNRGVLRIRPSAPVPFDAAFARAALALPAAGVSDPVDEPEGFVIIERLKDPPSGPDQISARHILIGYAGSPKPVPDVTRTEAEALTLAEKVAQAAHEPNADWNALAAEYTDEPGGKASGGDLGKFGRGQMVAAFERAAFALGVGEISGVVKSPFGFHVIRRYE